MSFIDKFFARLFRVNLNNDDDRNSLYLVMEMFWASILSSAATFNAAFAIRLGANNFEVGLLTSVPALVAVLVSIPAGRFLQQQSRRSPWIYGALMLHRAGFLLVALAPWVNLPHISNGLLVVIILIMNTFTAHFFNVGWTPLLAEVVPENRRAALFAARNIVNGITLSIGGLLLGQWLTHSSFPGNYQIMYFVGFLASLVSMYYLVKLKVPDSIPSPPRVQVKLPLKERVRSARQAFTNYPEFLAITRNTLLHGIGLWMAAPLYTLYFVRTLEASDGWLGINSMVASLGTIVGYGFWRWLMSRWGEPVTLKRTIVLIGLYPALVGLMPSLTPILLLSALNGLISPGVNLSHFNTLLRCIPAEARPQYNAMYIAVMNTFAFICPMLSVVIADAIGLGPTLIASGLLSVIGSSAFWWWPVTRETKEPTPVQA